MIIPNFDSQNFLITSPVLDFLLKISTFSFCLFFDSTRDWRMNKTESLSYDPCLFRPDQIDKWDLLSVGTSSIFIQFSLFDHVKRDLILFNTMNCRSFCRRSLLESFLSNRQSCDPTLRDWFNNTILFVFYSYSSVLLEQNSRLLYCPQKGVKWSSSLNIHIWMIFMLK